jgi:hypothetical protein
MSIVCVVDEGFVDEHDDVNAVNDPAVDVVPLLHAAAVGPA